VPGGRLHVHAAARVSGRAHHRSEHLQRTEAAAQRRRHSPMRTQPDLRNALQDHHRRQVPGLTERLHSALTRFSFSPLFFFFQF